MLVIRAALLQVSLSYLKSYRGMGTAQVACVSGCACEPQLLDGTWENKVSLQQILQFWVRARDVHVACWADLSACRQPLLVGCVCMPFQTGVAPRELGGRAAATVPLYTQKQSLCRHAVLPY